MFTDVYCIDFLLMFIDAVDISQNALEWSAWSC